MRACRSCGSGCYLLTKQCLTDGDPVLTPRIPDNQIFRALDKAQQLYLETPLGNCFSDLCEAVKEFEANNTPIPQAYLDLIEAATDMLKATTGLWYLRLFGRQRFPDMAERKEQLSNAQATAEDEKLLFYKWLAKNQAAYPCLPNLEEECDVASPEGNPDGAWLPVPPRRGINRRFPSSNIEM